MNDDFRDLLHALLRAGAEFLVVGAHAMAVHGVPRATGHLDIWVRPDPPNADRVWQALVDFGAPATALGVSREDLETRGIVVQIGLPPRRLDILTEVSGLDFDEGWRNRVMHRVGSHDIPFLSRHDLIRNKRASGRPKDIADLEILERDKDVEGYPRKGRVARRGATRPASLLLTRCRRGSRLPRSMETSRRGFLMNVAGLAGAGIAARLSDDALPRARAAASGAGGRAPEVLAADEDFWREIQDAYAIDRGIINLNNGGVCPSPRTVQESLRRHLEFSNHAPAYTMWQVLEPQIESVRQRLARSFGCDPEEIAITRNASEALEICLLGLDLRPGDEVLTTTQDYPRMLATLDQRARREGIVVRKISFPTPPRSLAALRELFEKNLTPATKAILVCHITNLTGQIFPVREICRLGRERGIEVIVDGAHAFAHFPFTRDDLECDFYGTSLHKWLCAPIGTGFLYVRREKIDRLWPLMAAPREMGTNIRKFEEIGTHPAANHNAIAEAITFHDSIGGARKIARLRHLRDRWMRRLEGRPGVILRTSFDPAQAGALANVAIEGVDPKRLERHLWEAHRILVVAIDHPECPGIRVTPNVYTTLEEIDRFSDSLESIILKGMPA